VSQSTLAELRALEINPDHQMATMSEALDLLKDRALINIDLKAAGYEAAVLELVHAKGLSGDVIYSSVISSSLKYLRNLEPKAVIGLSYPEDRGDASRKPYLQPIVNSVVTLMRLTLPYRILSMIAAAQADAVMLYHKVVSHSVIQKVHQAGGKVFTWTVDEHAKMQELQKMGVNGITTNYPDLFISTR
jgi:glycerophosphoryl diester phosphodiesterase